VEFFDENDYAAAEAGGDGCQVNDVRGLTIQYPRYRTPAMFHFGSSGKLGRES
jgi:hypothetical protein